jgi:hypothetical protein
LNKGKRSLGKAAAGRWAAAVGTFVLIAGCHGNRQAGDRTILERIRHAGHSKIAILDPEQLAEKGRTTIVTECEKQSYETASKGLIVSETGLHEDVFALRDRETYAGVGYGLDAALKLENLLRAEAKVAGHPVEQADCIEEFADHLETLSDPLVEADERQKELDLSAFKDAAKEVQRQADKTLVDADKATAPEAEPATTQPH